MNFATWLGLAIGVTAILAGHVLEGGHVGSIVQGTAAVIVFGGTLGAVFVSHSREQLSLSVSLLKEALFGSPNKREIIAREIIEAAILARKESILSIEKNLHAFSDHFTKTVFRFVIDGVEAATIREIFENEIDVEQERLLGGAKVFMDAGGFAPTIGIIGAVLGLIHVMENLTDTSKLGAGIAVAFVATVYGVGSANLIFIPLANKIRKRIKERSKTKEMILVGALGVLAGLNPYIIEEKLKIYLHDDTNIV